jgi:hypothetical protein
MAQDGVSRTPEIAQNVQFGHFMGLRWGMGHPANSHSRMKRAHEPITPVEILMT